MDEIHYARLEKKGAAKIYIAGISLDAIIAGAQNFLPRAQVIPIDKNEIPDSYNWSVQRVERIPNWRRNGTYMLLKNFETYGASFEKFHRQITFN